MQEKGSKKNLIIVGAIILAVGAACYFYVTREEPVPDLLAESSMGSGAPVDGDLISALSSLRRLKIDSSIFAGAVWGTLFDFSAPIAPQDAGRPNPFAPIGGAVAPTAETQ